MEAAYIVTRNSIGTVPPLRATSLEELKPLFELCKAGRLFEVQEWIAAGKPVDPPAEKPKHSKFRSPLTVAIDQGFHSLVEVLLKGGALQEPDDYDSPMSRALRMRRRDLVELFVEHGYAPESVDMTTVVASWDPGLMEYFIERGADVVSGNPFAWAFCCQIRTALNVYKRYLDRFPALREQANIALRRHCKKGNMKWISLLLWAGADPYAPGASSDDEVLEDDRDGTSALVFAAIYDHYDVFKLKPIRSRPTHPGLRECIYFLGDDNSPLKKSGVGGLPTALGWRYIVACRRIAYQCRDSKDGRTTDVTGTPKARTTG